MAIGLTFVLVSVAMFLWFRVLSPLGRLLELSDELDEVEGSITSRDADVHS
jgi:HAMP domain-containing protein